MLLLRNLQGQTTCLSFATPTVSVDVLQQRIQEHEGVPVRFQRLVAGTRDLCTSDTLDVSRNDVLVNLLLRLAGGKGTKKI